MFINDIEGGDSCILLTLEENIFFGLLTCICYIGLEFLWYVFRIREGLKGVLFLLSPTIFITIVSYYFVDEFLFLVYGFGATPTQQRSRVTLGCALRNCSGPEGSYGMPRDHTEVRPRLVQTRKTPYYLRHHSGHL